MVTGSHERLDYQSDGLPNIHFNEFDRRRASLPLLEHARRNSLRNE